MGFVIRNAEGKEFKLESLEAFEQLYEPEGYAILDPQPLGGVLPERPAKKETAKEQAEREKAEKAAAEKAEADAKADAEKAKLDGAAQ